MRPHSFFVTVTGLAILASVSAAHAADNSADNSSTDKSAIDPGTMAALQKMGAYLRTLTAFQVETQGTDEDVLPDGEKVQYSSTASILARKPNRLRAEISNDQTHRVFLYNGSTFTLFADRLGYYATVPAPPTIRQLVDRLQAQNGLDVPLQDLFRWGADGWTANGITHAMDVGPSEIGGTSCEQYAIRQADEDWQIWLQLGDYPLPRKLVITTRTDEARPQHTVVYSWNLAPSYDETAFIFSPPPGAERVVLPTLAAAAPRARAKQ